MDERTKTSDNESISPSLLRSTAVLGKLNLEQSLPPLDCQIPHLYYKNSIDI